MARRPRERPVDDDDEEDDDDDDADNDERSVAEPERGVMDGEDADDREEVGRLDAESETPLEPVEVESLEESEMNEEVSSPTIKRGIASDRL